MDLLHSKWMRTISQDYQKLFPSIGGNTNKLECSYYSIPYVFKNVHISDCLWLRKLTTVSTKATHLRKYLNLFELNIEKVTLSSSCRHKVGETFV